MRNFKKFLALVLAMLMVVSAAATVSAFEDVAEGDPFAEAIADLSVLDIVKAFEKACGKEIPYVIKERRPGDISTCYADPAKAKEELDWIAERGLDEMCEDTWRWQSGNPNGYEA